MDVFKGYEKKVLTLLASRILSPNHLNDIERDAELVDYEYTGSGYFLEVRHSSLPQERIVCDKPIVIGETDGITCGFIIFIEKGKLTIECHSWGEINVPENFRDKNVQVKAVTIEDGSFVLIED